MKKKLLSILLGFTFALSLFLGAVPSMSVKAITTNEINFEIVNKDKLIEMFNNISNQSLSTRGFKVTAEKSPKTGLVSSYYILVQSGQKNTGGYSIRPLSVEDVEGTTVITVEETSPRPDSMVTQALTYPHFVIRIPENISPRFVVKDTKGVTFDLLQSDLSIIKQPKDIEKVLNKIITVKGTFIKQNGSGQLIVLVGKNQMKFQLSNNAKKYFKLKDLKPGKRLSVKYSVKNKNFLAEQIQIIK